MTSQVSVLTQPTGWSRARRIGAATAAAGFLTVSAMAPLSFTNAFAQDFAQDRESALFMQDSQELTVAASTEPALHLGAAEAVEATSESVAPPGASLSLNDFLFRGVVNWGGYKFTYYSQQVLPGGGLNISGRHVNAGGYVSDGDGYIVLAGSAPMGTVFDTPFGYQGKIYDRGTVGNHLDVYIR